MRTLITCHANADCDAFASILAARHLYEEADLLFPGSQEVGLNRIIGEIDRKKYSLLGAGEIKWDDYDTLVVCDTRQRSRLGHVLPLLERKGIKIDILDHHPATREDIRGDRVEISRNGACVSSICLDLAQKGIAITEEEATFMGMGIYADTGSFTYSSTTADDFRAAAWLLGQGMDVRRINDMACHELTGMHIQALNLLLESSRTYMVNDIPVTLAEARLDNYLGDFAYLAHKLLEMEKSRVLFAIGVMGDRIQIVARSSCENVNVGKVCAIFGGGGHAYAASASVRDKVIHEVRERILRAVDEQVNPPRTARDYMSTPAVGLESGSTLREADELMLHFGLKAVPIFRPGTKVCAGLLDAQTAARGVAHGLGQEKVDEFMQRRVATLPPDAPLQDFAEIIVGSRQRLVPIVENEAVVGVVTRTDLINVFANESGSLQLLRKNATRPTNVAKLMRDRLPEEVRRILTLSGELGRKLGLPVYAVGGFARDLLMNYPNQDIDLVAEGNGIALARALAHELGGRVREHEKFLTSVVIYHDREGNERHIDVATARLEYYEYPAALPTVELSSIKMDLFRRDFSINALAIRLDCEPAGDVVDFFGGQRDIKDGLIRVLHTLSFVEDPTRCIRAVRFEQRYKFRIGPGTEKLIRNILPMHLLDKLSSHRLFNEFCHLCDEENSAECLIRLDELGILKALGQKLVLNPAKISLLKKVKGILSWHKLLFFEETSRNWICYFLAISHNLNYADALKNYNALGMPAARKDEIMRQREHMRKTRPQLLEWQKGYSMGKAKISQLYELLSPLDLEILLYLMATVNNGELKKNISRFITQWRREKADINGNDLKRLGVPQGPQYGNLLKRALLEKLDGKAPNAKSQLAFVLKCLKKDNA